MDERIANLMRAYPDCDYTMAETLFKMHEQGKLKDYDFDAKALAPSTLVEGKIYVASTENEKSALPSIICEATLAD